MSSSVWVNSPSKSSKNTTVELATTGELFVKVGEAGRTLGIIQGKAARPVIFDAKFDGKKGINVIPCHYSSKVTSGVFIFFLFLLTHWPANESCCNFFCIM